VGQAFDVSFVPNTPSGVDHKSGVPPDEVRAKRLGPCPTTHPNAAQVQDDHLAPAGLYNSVDDAFNARRAPDVAGSHGFSIKEIKRKDESVGRDVLKHDLPVIRTTDGL
jgi:hypothetical protein